MPKYAMLMLLLPVVLGSCVNLPPEVFGAVYRHSPEEKAEIIAVARQHLATSIPSYHIFRLWIESDDEAHVYYRRYGGPAQHIILRRVNDKWHVTKEQIQKMYPQEDLQDMIMTP